MVKNKMMDEYNAELMIMELSITVEGMKKIEERYRTELSQDQNERHFNLIQMSMLEGAQYHLVRCVNELEKLLHDLRIDYDIWDDNEMAREEIMEWRSIHGEK